MYLFIYADGSAKQVHDNLTIGDLLAVRQLLLKVYRVRDEKYELLLPDEKTLTWVPVREAKTASNSSARFHL